MDDIAVRQKLERFGFSEVSRLATTFSAWRDGKDGAPRRVLVEIWDSGPDSGQSRFHVRAKSEDGISDVGNGAPDVETAIAIAHWGKFGD